MKASLRHTNEKVTSKFLRVNGSIVQIDVSGMVCPSFKNAKRAILDRNTGQMRTLTQKSVAQRKKKLEDAIVSALFSSLPTDAATTQMDAALQSLIASLPPDDDWKILRRIAIDSALSPEHGPAISIIIEQANELTQ